MAQSPYDGLPDGRPACEMEFTLGQFILALVGSGAVSGAVFSLWTYLATQRFNAQEALRTAGEIKDEFDRADALSEFAQVQAEAGDATGAKETCKEALKILL